MLKTAHVATACAVIFAGFVAWIIAGGSHGTTLKAVDDIVFVVLTIMSVVLTALAARSAHGRSRTAWVAMTVAMLGWAVGEILWAYYELALDEVPFPSLADAAYLVMPVGACVAMLLFPAEYSGQSRGRMLLDGLIVAGSLFMVSWVTILSPLYQTGADSRLALVISLAYPVSDLVILTIAGMALLRAASDQRLVLTLLTVGMICTALSDSGFTYLSAENEYATGNAIDIGWVAGILLITVAAAASRDDERHQQTSAGLPGWASIWFPYAPVLLAGIVAAAEPASIFQTPLVEIIGSLLVVAVLGRQYLAVSENRRLLVLAAEQALRDPLTGLANRALFRDRLDEAMALRERDHVSVALVALDLNDFKLVNDTLGHPAGDELLTRAGERILGCVRNGDTVARLGGDEFLVLIEDSAEHSDLVAHRVVESFDKPFAIEGRELFIRPSVGLAVADADESGVTAEELVKRADVAMYSAKKSRTAGVHTFTPELQLANPPDDGVLHRFRGTPSGADAAAIHLLGELRQAIGHGELTLAYQPKFDLRTGAIVGVEALVRWPHRKRGLLSPDEFLPLVRGHGLMGPVTDLVINMALDDALRWHQAGLVLPVAVNVSAPLLADPHLPARIERALADRGLPAAALTVEITEDMLLGNMEGTRDVLNQLRRNGIRIAIDDFGTGYSTLSYLCELPVDEVKLDREFILPVVADARVATVVRAVIELAHELGLTTVAEGVEDAEIASRLADYGCDVVQGFHFSPPVSSEEVLRLAGLPTAVRPASNLARP